MNYFGDKKRLISPKSYVDFEEIRIHAKKTLKIS